MATVPIRDILDNETGEPIFPRTHVKAVIGLADSNFFEEYVDGNGARSVKLRSDYVGLWADGWIAAGGIGTGGGGGGGLITSVKGVADLGTPIATESLTETFSAYAIQSIYNSVRLKSAVALSNVLPYASGRVRVATLTIDGTNHDIYAPEPTGGGGVETETDPIFSASAAFGISTTDIANWNAKVSNIQADWNATTGLAAILNRPSLSAVATSGSYNDLSNKPSIPNEATVSGWGFTKNTGTVTRVAMKVPTGLSVSGSPITASGTLAISFANGYSIPTTSKQSGWDAKYDKPSGGIPKTDLASAVQTSLGKADTALQSETDPTVPAWAKSATKPSYAFSELTSHPTTLSGYGITDAKFGTPGTDNVPITLGSTTKSVLTDHQDLTPLTNRLSAIEDWFEVVNVGTSESPNYALHAKQGRAIYSDSWIAAGGVGSGSSSSGGLITRVRSITDLGTAIATESLTETFSAKAIEGIYEEVRNLTGSGLATQTWVNNQGFLKTETDPTVPAWAKAANKPSYAFSELTSHPTTLAGYGITDGFKKTGGDISGDIYHEIEEEDVETGEIVIHEMWRISENGEAIFDSLDVDGVSVRPRDYVTKANAQTITGAKTFSGNITMSGANILSSADSVNQIGSVTNRFGNGFFRNLYTTYFGFRDDNDGSIQRGTIGMGDGYTSIYMQRADGTPYGQYVFNAAYGFFHGANGDVPCGRSDHRWSKVWSVDADLSGGLVIGGDIVPAADLGSQLGYSSRRFATGSIVNINTRSVIFKHQTTEKNDGLIAGGDGYFRFRTGADIDTAYKDIVFHETYGFYPEQSGVNLGYGSAAQYRWATIYGVNADLTGDLALASSSHIDIGPLRIEYDATNKALHITKKDSTDTETYGIYADGFVAAGGVGQTS